MKRKNPKWNENKALKAFKGFKIDCIMEFDDREKGRDGFLEYRYHLVGRNGETMVYFCPIELLDEYGEMVHIFISSLPLAPHAMRLKYAWDAKKGEMVKIYQRFIQEA